MAWSLFTLTLAVLLYTYAYRGILNQKKLSDEGRVFRKWVVGIVIIIHAVTVYYGFYHYKSTETYSEKVAEPALYYEKCGKVYKKIEGHDNSNNSSSSSYEEMLVIHYKNGDVERKNVSRKTYDNYEEGDGICFAEETEWNSVYHLFMFIATVFSVVGGIICIAYSLEAEFD